jgi:hypothetical protein
MENSYEISSIKRSEDAPDREPAEWYDYVIAFRGVDAVNGRRPGSLKEVTSAVNEIVGQLNERHCKKSGKAKKA